MEKYDDGNSSSEVGKSFSVPSFLRKAFADALRNDDGGLLDHKLFRIAVCAVLLESGFVEIDPKLKIFKCDNFNAQWNYYYGLPNIISGGIEYVKIVFQNLGKYCKVYGSLNNGTGIHSVLFEKDKLPILNVVWAKIGQVVDEKAVSDFWRKVKDGFVLPLSIDLCEKNGLELPSSFIKLPTELKLKILESVSGVDNLI
ncbi:F-box domain, cyclin-like protein [Artemisia annua]|uniref:F-box domain, cyclin-like protein n=1 Tax=Artemisia annua TaxID=35608 RepID=A0A2U1LEH8_ARTAN|nr:F-box domain, cyclin-like protein [Artemisia annua]